MGTAQDGAVERERRARLVRPPPLLYSWTGEITTRQGVDNNGRATRIGNIRYTSGPGVIRRNDPVVPQPEQQPVFVPIQYPEVPVVAPSGSGANYPNLDPDDSGRDSAIDRVIERVYESALVGRRLPAEAEVPIIERLLRACLDYVREDGLPEVQRQGLQLSMRSVELATSLAGRTGSTIEAAHQYLQRVADSEAGRQLWMNILRRSNNAAINLAVAGVDGVQYTATGVAMLAQFATAYGPGAASRFYDGMIRGTQTLLEATRYAIQAGVRAGAITNDIVQQGISEILTNIPPEVVLGLLGNGIRQFGDSVAATRYTTQHLMGMVWAYVPPNLRMIQNVYEVGSDQVLRYVYGVAQAYRREYPERQIQQEELPEPPQQQHRRRRNSNGIDPANIVERGQRRAAAAATENQREAARESRTRYERPRREQGRRTRLIARLPELLVNAGFANNIPRESLSRATVAAVNDIASGQNTPFVVEQQQQQDAYPTPEASRPGSGRATPKGPPRGGYDTPP